MSTASHAARGTELFFKRMRGLPTIELADPPDLDVPDREAEVNRIIGLGAKLVETKMSQAGELTETLTVLRDPEGNGFCVKGPDPRRPHPYVGDVTFSCAEPRRVLGPFWSKALDSPEQKVEESFLQMLRDPPVDVDREFYAYYAIDGNAARPPFFPAAREVAARLVPIHLELSC
jgi:hypothetical protein